MTHGAKLRFYLALGFLLWSVLPHFSLYLHSHAGDGKDHQHALLTAAQLAEVQALAASAAEAFGEGALDPSFGLSEGQADRSADGDARLASSLPIFHGHIQEDANVLSTPWSGMDAGPQPAPAASPCPPLLAPAFLSLPAFLARGPPPFLAAAA